MPVPAIKFLSAFSSWVERVELVASLKLPSPFADSSKSGQARWERRAQLCQLDGWHTGLTRASVSQKSSRRRQNGLKRGHERGRWVARKVLPLGHEISLHARRHDGGHR